MPSEDWIVSVRQGRHRAAKLRGQVGRGRCEWLRKPAYSSNVFDTALVSKPTDQSRHRFCDVERLRRQPNSLGNKACEEHANLRLRCLPQSNQAHLVSKKRVVSIRVLRGQGDSSRNPCLQASVRGGHWHVTSL